MRAKRLPKLKKLMVETATATLRQGMDEQIAIARAWTKALARKR